MRTVLVLAAALCSAFGVHGLPLEEDYNVQALVDEMLRDQGAPTG